MNEAAQPVTAVAQVKSYPHLAYLYLALYGGRLHRSVEIDRQGFLHAAHWTIVRRLPDADGTPAPKIKPQLLFAANFNGDVDDYIETFTRIVPDRIDVIYKRCEGFLESRKVTHLIWYVKDRNRHPDLYYRAYPTASTRMIRSALSATHGPADRLPDGVPIQPQQGLRAWLDVARMYRRAPMTIHTSLTPVRPGEAADLQAELRALDRERPSPLDLVGGVHFARFVVVDASFRSVTAETDPSQPCYLVFSAVYDRSGARAGADRRFVRSLLAGRFAETADRIWGHCAGYPVAAGVDKRAGYLRRHSHPTPQTIVGYGATVEQVKQACEQVENLTEEALETSRAALEPGPGARRPTVSLTLEHQ